MGWMLFRWKIHHFLTELSLSARINTGTSGASSH